MTLGDALGRESLQYGIDQQRSDAAPTLAGVDHQMLQIAAPPVMPGQQPGHNCSAILDQQTQPRIARQIGAERRVSVVGPQLDAGRTPP